MATVRYRITNSHTGAIRLVNVNKHTKGPSGLLMVINTHRGHLAIIIIMHVFLVILPRMPWWRVLTVSNLCPVCSSGGCLTGSVYGHKLLNQRSVVVHTNVLQLTNTSQAHDRVGQVSVRYIWCRMFAQEALVVGV